MSKKAQPFIVPRTLEESRIRRRNSVGRRLLPDSGTLSTVVETSANGIRIDAGAEVGVTIRFGDRAGGAMESYAGEYALTPNDNGRIFSQSFETLIVTWDQAPGAKSFDVTFFTGIRVSPVESAVDVQGSSRQRDLSRGSAAVAAPSFTTIWDDFDLSFVSADDNGEVLPTPVVGGYPGNRWRGGSLRAMSDLRLVGLLSGDEEFTVLVSSHDGTAAMAGYQFLSMARPGIGGSGDWETVDFTNRPTANDSGSGGYGPYVGMVAPRGGFSIIVYSLLAQTIQWEFSLVSV